MNDVMCHVDYFVTWDNPHVRLRGQCHLHSDPHQQIGIKIQIKCVKWIGLVHKAVFSGS
jgi:hypothetical protein